MLGFRMSLSSVASRRRPIWGLRDYDVPGQIGLEEDIDIYVARLVDVFKEVWRVIRDDGTLWLNLGDRYSSAGKSERDFDPKLPKRSGRHRGLVTAKNGIKQKELIGIPWKVAFALQEDGWYLRSDIIWAKPNPMPESIRDRPTKSHEYLFLLSKKKQYYYDNEAIKEDCVSGSRGSRFDTGKTAKNGLGRVSTKERVDNVRRNKRDVWTVATQCFKGAHFATFPPELIRPCILAGCPQGGVVLDPFSGAGTTGLVAMQEGRRSILIELKPEYVEVAKKRCGGIRPEKPVIIGGDFNGNGADQRSFGRCFRAGIESESRKRAKRT